jgi:hypothetical protein
MREYFSNLAGRGALLTNSSPRMNIIVNIITGRIQDADNNSYDRVTIVYVVLAGGSVVVSIALAFVSVWSIDLARLQWTRLQRIRNGNFINERKERFTVKNGAQNRRLSMYCFGGFCALVVGSWVAYIWGAATGNNY